MLAPLLQALETMIQERAEGFMSLVDQVILRQVKLKSTEGRRMVYGLDKVATR